MKYTEFRETIRSAFLSFCEGLTWKEIQERTQLPQERCMSPEPTERLRESVERLRRARERSRRHLLLSAGLGLIGVGVLVACGGEERQSGAYQLPKGRLRAGRSSSSGDDNR